MQLLTSTMSWCFQGAFPLNQLIQNKVGEIKSLEQIESEYYDLLKKQTDDQNDQELSEHGEFSPAKDLIEEEDDNYDFNE